MRCAALIAVLLLFGCPMVTAQTYPIAELYGGYSLYCVHSSRVHGWGGSGIYNINRWLGVVADLSGHYFPETVSVSGKQTVKSDARQYRFYAGPRYSFRRLKETTPFAHLLLGVLSTHTDYSYPFSTETRSNTRNIFSAGVGAGLDIKANERIGVRIIQVDFLRDFSIGPPRVRTDGIRIGIGLVVNLGKK